MYPNKKLAKVIEAAEQVANEWQFKVLPLNGLSDHNKFCFQPYGMKNCIGPGEQNIRQFMHEVLWRHLPENIRNELTIQIGSSEVEDKTDINCCEPDFALESKIYHIEMIVE